MTFISKIMRFSGELCNEGMTKDLVIESDWLWHMLHLEMFSIRKCQNPPEKYDDDIKIFSFGPDVIVRKKKIIEKLKVTDYQMKMLDAYERDKGMEEKKYIIGGLQIDNLIDACWDLAMKGTGRGSIVKYMRDSQILENPYIEPKPVITKVEAWMGIALPPLNYKILHLETPSNEILADKRVRWVKLEGEYQE